MNDNLARREAARPRRLSAASASDAGANVSLQDGDIIEVHPARETQTGPGFLGAAAGRMERRNSTGVHQRHMPMEPLKFHIPRKTKEKQPLFQHVSTESREYEDMMTILTSSYMDTSSAGCFTYSMPRLVHSELLEKEFVEKRKEMKSDGRTDKELEESYCFLLSDTAKLPQLCEKGLFVGHSWITTLGNPTKGVYLSRYSDLLQVNSFMLGATGEIIIFKVMKGKVKSIYENMKNLLDPTPRFDSHISKNASKVTSLTSYRALELTQQYFYEYSFDELRQRPRQVCPYAVISFQFKGKDSALPSKPLAPVRLNSQSAEGSKERAQFTVWTGDLVKGHRVLFQISLRSSSPPLLPHRLPEKLEIGRLMRLDQVTKLLPSKLLSYNLYSSSQEVVKNGQCSSLLEVVDRSRSTTSVTKLLHELEINQVVLVTPLTDKGFLILLSSVQMATPSERGESWKRCLQALFVFPESRDVAKFSLRSASSSHDASESLLSGRAVMPRLNQFVPALHFSLIKARANPPPELSVGVESQAQEYLIGLNDSKVRHYPMDKYDSKLDERGKPSPPKHHKGNMDGYLRSYLYNPAHYLLSVVRARQMVETYCGPEEPQQARSRKSYGGQREATGKEATSGPRDGQTNTQKMQQLIDLVLTCKRNAENEVSREEGGGGGGAVQAPGRKRRLEQETAERALKFLKASQEPGRHSKIAVEGNQAPYCPGSLASVIGSVGLRDVDLREDGSELATTLLSLLTGLDQAAKGSANQSFCDMQEEMQRGSCPFDGVAARLGLPTNCDIDLRKQEELEEHTAGSVSSVEGFSPSSHSGEMNHHGAGGRGGGGRGLGRRAGVYEEEEDMREVPWILIPITGLSSERYNHRDRNIPQDPRFQHLTTATSVTTATNPPRKSPSPSPEPSPPPSPSQCPSPDPSPPPSPSQCPSPEPSPPPSPEPSPPPSPSQCPSPPSPSQCLSPPLSHPSSPSRCRSLEPNELRLLNKDHSGANEEQFARAGSRETSEVSKPSEESHHRRQKTAERSTSTSTQASVPPPPPPTEQEKAGAVREALAKTLNEVKEKGEQEADEVDQDVEDVMEVMPHVGGDKRRRDTKEPVGSSVVSPAVSSLPFRPLRQIDSIVDKHLGDFSSEIQSVLQEESIQYSFPQSPHSTSNTEATAPQHTLPYSPISQFSQYVSFYYPCPPVQDYVSSLQDGMDSVIKEFDDSWPSCKPATSRTHTDAALASTVSAFVSSIRAANTSTGKEMDEDIYAGAATAADTCPPVSQITPPSRGGEAWQPHTNADHFPDATNSPSHAAAHDTLSVSTSASGSVYKPSAAVLHPPHSQSHWKPHQSRTLDITRTVTNDARQTPDHGATRTAYPPRGEGGSSLAGASCEVALPGYRGPPKPSTEPSHPSEQSSNPASVPGPGPGPDSGPTPPAAALSSLISQLQPEVFNSLVEIIKDVRKNSLQFYLHSSEPEDPINEDIKEHLLKQGNVEQSPVTFLHQENSDNRLLVIIKNKDIAAHVHTIPSLVTLKRHPTVVFLGIDTLDDIRNNSYNELFVAGGCIVSDEFVLNPDFMTHDRLVALLMLLEQHSSPSSIWRWKIHCKTHKKLKEQARFRRDAANLLEVLSAYQKRQIVEFLPYHHCDMDNQSPDLDCLLELQARYTQYRHTVLLTEHHFEKFSAYSSSGIIIASIEEILRDFPRLIGYHDIRDKQPIMDEILAPKGHIHSLSPHDQPKHLLQESSSGRLLHPHISDQLVPDASFKDGLPHHSGKDLEDLRMAISHLRAERQAKQQLLQLKQQQLQQQLQQHQSKLDSQAEMNSNPFERFLPTRAGSRHSSPPPETVQPPPGKEAVAATLELIHSALQLELEEEEKKEAEAGRRRSGGGHPGDQKDGAPIRVAGCAGENSDLSTPSSNQNTAAVTGPSDQRAATKNGREEAHHRGETTYPHAAKPGAASSSNTTGPVEGDRSRAVQSKQEQPTRGEGAPPDNCNVGPASAASVTGSITMVTDQEDNPNLAVPHQRHHQHRPHQQNNQQPSHLQSPHHRQQQRRAGLLQHPHLPQLPGQHFAGAPLLGPLSAMGGSLLGPTPVWPGHTGTAALVWGLQQAGRDLTSSRLLYHNPAGQGGMRYRGGHRGGGFNGM